MRIKNVLTTVAAIGALGMACGAQAVTCSPSTMTVNGVTGVGGGSDERKAVSTSASCHVTVGGTTGTPAASDIGAALGGSWTAAGSVTDANGSGGYLTITVSPSWGTDLTGTWTISPGFYATYGSAALSLHVGNGRGDPDWWIWKLSPGATSGTFAYENSGQGGGLSNLFLWGSGAPREVPEPATLGLLGLGLAGVGVARRRRVAG